MCEKYLGVNAISVLDPTLLLAKDEYAKLCDMSIEELRMTCGGWMVVVPASRFNIEWDCNKPALLKLFYDYFAQYPIES